LKGTLKVCKNPSLEENSFCKELRKVEQVEHTLKWRS